MTTTTIRSLADGHVDPDLLEHLAAEVTAVEEELMRQTNSSVGLVERVGKHILRAGGKRIRPAFVSLCAEATGLPYERLRVRQLGAAMELIHMETSSTTMSSTTRRPAAVSPVRIGSTATLKQCLPATYS